jgi:uncharacterized protein affecting Mg2+/Co2+ transport
MYRMMLRHAGCCCCCCRVRITNNRSHPIKVLGRGWVVHNSRGELDGLVKLAPDNGVVGEASVTSRYKPSSDEDITKLKRAATHKGPV